MSKKPKIMQTKLKKFIYDNGLMVIDIVPFTKKADSDGFGLSKHHIYRICNGHIQCTETTIKILSKALTLILQKQITPNDIIDYS